MDYEKMLEKAKEALPEKDKKERFVIPSLEVSHSGRQTIIKNFVPVVKLVHRKPQEVAKFFYKELAVPGSINRNELVLQGKVSVEMVEKRFEEYLKDFVICAECSKYDTTIHRDGNINFIKCSACGARRPVKKV